MQNLLVKIIAVPLACAKYQGHTTIQKYFASSRELYLSTVDFPVQAFVLEAVVVLNLHG